VAVLRRRQGRTIDTFQTLVNPQRRISPGAAQVNHLTDQDVTNAPTFDQIAPRLVVFLDDAVLVAHNAPFDLGFLANEWQRLRWPPRDGFVIDTLALARRLYALGSNNLAAVARGLGVPRGQAHRALGDVQTTARVLDRMFNDVLRRGIFTLGDLLALQGGNVKWPTPPRLDLRHGPKEL
jgi:DNA polymerase III epsilon subunit family exonuclease